MKLNNKKEETKKKKQKKREKGLKIVAVSFIPFEEFCSYCAPESS